MDTDIKYREQAAAVLDFIEKHPSQHDQGSWYNPPIDLDEGVNTVDPEVCGTTLCTAGTAIYLNHGMEALLNPHNHLNTGYFDAGREILGLDVEEASLLFYECDEAQAVEALGYIKDGNQDAFENLGRDVIGDENWRDCF